MIPRSNQHTHSSNNPMSSLNTSIIASTTPCHRWIAQAQTVMMHRLDMPHHANDVYYLYLLHVAIQVAATTEAVLMSTTNVDIHVHHDAIMRQCHVSKDGGRSS